MEIIPEDRVWEEFWRGYSRKPKVWRVYTGLSSKGYPEILLTGEQESWLIKRESIYSGKPGVGGRVMEGYDLGLKTEPFGLREVPVRMLEKIASSITSGIESQEVAQMIIDTMGRPPSIPERISSPVALEGPILQTFKPLHLVSEKQIELDRRLELELEKWKSKIGYIR